MASDEDFKSEEDSDTISPEAEGYSEDEPMPSEGESTKSVSPTHAGPKVTTNRKAWEDAVLDMAVSGGF